MILKPNYLDAYIIQEFGPDAVEVLGYVALMNFAVEFHGKAF